MAKIVVAVLLAGVLTIGTAKECNEKELNRCFANLKNSVTENLKDSKHTDKNTYCESVKEEGNCISEASEACKKKYPEVSTMVSTFYDYLSHMCTEAGKVYMEMVPCFEDHRSEFEKCMPKGKTNPDDPLGDICNSVSELQCVAKLSKKLCKNGEAFGKALDDKIRTLKDDICPSSTSSGTVTGYFKYSSWILVFILPFAYGCPSAQKLLPCTCKGEWNRQEDIICPGLLNEQTIMDVMHAFSVTKNFYSFTIEDSNFRFLPHDIFKGIKFREFKIVSSTFMSLTDTNSALEGLEEHLVSLIVSGSTILNTWDWSVLKKFTKLDKLSIEADLTEISDEISQLQSVNLKEISFANNAISNVHDTAFSVFKDVKSISLRQNSIPEVKRSMMPNPAPMLWKLDLGYNEIQQLPIDLFSNMPSLTDLYIDSNHLLILSEKPFSDVWAGLKHFDAINNPLRCNCQMIWMTRLKKPEHVNAACDQPLHMRGRNLIELTEKDLWC